jgi:hypothetical protein
VVWAKFSFQWKATASVCPALFTVKVSRRFHSLRQSPDREGGSYEFSWVRESARKRKKKTQPKGHDSVPGRIIDS